jgi:hypothetical protein
MISSEIVDECLEFAPDGCSTLLPNPPSFLSLSAFDSAQDEVPFHIRCQSIIGFFCFENLRNIGPKQIIAATFRFKPRVNTTALRHAPIVSSSLRKSLTSDRVQTSSELEELLLHSTVSIGGWGRTKAILFHSPRGAALCKTPARAAPPHRAGGYHDVLPSNALAAIRAADLTNPLLVVDPSALRRL